MDAQVSVTWIELLCLVFLLVPIAALCAPLRARRWALTVLQRAVQIAALAVIIAYGVFLVAPSVAPEWASSALEPVADFFGQRLGKPYQPLVWLVVATAAGLIAAPLAILIGFVRKLDTLGALLRRIVASFRATGGQKPETAAAWREIFRGGDEVDDAVRTMAATTSERAKQPRRRESLVRRRPDQGCAVALVITKLDSLRRTGFAAGRAAAVGAFVQETVVVRCVGIDPGDQGRPLVRRQLTCSRCSGSSSSTCGSRRLRWEPNCFGWVTEASEKRSAVDTSSVPDVLPSPWLPNSVWYDRSNPSPARSALRSIPPSGDSAP
jgi:hypothetical protein